MKLLVCVLALFFAVSGHAHDLWIERTPEGNTLFYGHKHSEHGGDTIIEYLPRLVVRTDCFDSTGERIDAEIIDSYPVRISGDCAVTFVLTSSGYWTKTPYTTKNCPKTEVREPLASWLSYESVKRIDRWTALLAKPLTQDIEIVPSNNPFELGPGDKLRLVVTLEGKPVSGAVVAYDGKIRGQTGIDGRINVKIRHRGFQTVQATLRIPVSSGETDEIVHTANLNFEINDG